jgi:thymidylate kinase
MHMNFYRAMQKANQDAFFHVRSIVSDFGLIRVFEKMFRDGGMITEEDHKVFLAVRKQFFIPEPDLYIRVKVDPARAMYYIKMTRQRPEENGLTVDYLENLEREHDIFFEDIKNVVVVENQGTKDEVQKALRDILYDRKQATF